MLLLAAALCVAVGLVFSSAAIASGSGAGDAAMAVKNAANTDGAKVFVAPRRDRASELDLWDCVDELIDEEGYSQALAG